jgi:serine/threonine-protein kinase
MVCEAMASGGMGSIHLGRLLGPAGFARTVAIKVPHRNLGEDAQVRSMFLNEARLVARIRHVNVVPTLEVIADGPELYIVMEYVPGAPLSTLNREMQEREQRMPVRIAAAIVVGMLRGLHAAHVAKSELGEPLGIVHRDVSPSNVLIGTDGLVRVLDFGVAKAQHRLSTTPSGYTLKGKLAYMSPEQFAQGSVTLLSDVFAAGVVLWECLTAERLFAADNDAATVKRMLELKVLPPSDVARAAPIDAAELAAVTKLDPVAIRALERDPQDRFSSAQQMAAAIEEAVVPASPDDVARWMQGLVPELLEQRARLVERIEAVSSWPGSMPAERSPDEERERSDTRSMKGTSWASPQARPRARGRAVLAGTIAAGAVMGAAFLIHAKRAPEATSGATSGPAGTMVPPPPESEASISSAAPEVGGSSATPQPALPLLPEATAPMRAPNIRLAPSARPAPPTANCDPPYVWEDGVKKFRPECFRNRAPR